MANEEIDAILNEATAGAPGGAPKNLPVNEDLNAKVGRLVNETSELRRGNDALRAELEALRAQQSRPPVAQVGDAVEKGWEDWSSQVVNESPDDLWLTNPKEATRRVLKRGGKELANQSREIAGTVAASVGGALQMDSEFNRLYPDLGTAMGIEAQRQAIAELGPNPKFQQLMRLPITRPQALGAVAKLARQKLGVSDDSTAALDASTTQDQFRRKSVFAQPSGARPGGPIRDDKSEDDTKAMDAMIDFQKARS